MKIDRRCFLALGVGFSAGTALTPIPWKLMDDVAIWSQNWPWTPVPPEGEMTEVASVCTLCPGGCGISVRKIDQRVIKVEGLKDHPVNNGGVCIRGLTGPQLIYSPTRVRTPLKRVGERGAGKWEKISWDDAIAEVAQRLAALRAEDRPESVLTAFGSPNLVVMPSGADTAQVGLEQMVGPGFELGYDLEQADFIMGFGAGVLDGWGSPARVFKAHSAWKDHDVRMVQAEPRLSSTAARADLWLPVKPGTYGALALGIARVVLEHGGEDREFLAGIPTFDQWKKEVLDQYPISRVAEITGVDAALITQAGKEFSAARRPLALWGAGQGLTPGDLQEFMAVMALNALKGNMNRDGGIQTVPAADYIQWDAPALDDTAQQGLAQERVDGADAAGPSRASRFFANLAKGEGYGIEMLLIHQANPLYSLPATAGVQEALEKIPFIVSFASFKDETAMLADLILPNHIYLERFEDVPAASGMPRQIVGLSRPVVAPQHNTRHVGDVLLKIARAVGDPLAGAMAWDSHEVCLKETLGDRWDGLMESTFWEGASAGGAANFSFTAHGGKVMPDYREVAPEGDSGKYPLELIPYDTMRLAPRRVGSMPYMVKAVEDTVLKKDDVLVEINPATAKAYKLKEGQQALLTTPFATAKVRVHLSHGIRPELVALPRGLGHTAFDEFLKHKGVNINDLMGPTADPLTGLDAAWGIRAKLTRA